MREKKSNRIQIRYTNDNDRTFLPSYMTGCSVVTTPVPENSFFRGIVPFEKHTTLPTLQIDISDVTSMVYHCLVKKKKKLRRWLLAWSP